MMFGYSGHVQRNCVIFAFVALLFSSLVTWTLPSLSAKNYGLWRGKMFFTGKGEPLPFNFRIGDDGRIAGQFERPVGKYLLTQDGMTNGAGVVMKTHVPDKAGNEWRMRLPTRKDRDMAWFDLDKTLSVTFTGQFKGARMAGTVQIKFFKGPLVRCVLWLSGNDYVVKRFFRKEFAFNGKPLKKPDCSFITEKFTWSATGPGHTGQLAAKQPSDAGPDRADGDATARKLARHLPAS